MSTDTVAPDGLVFPRDLAAWRTWQEGRRPLRRAKDRATALLGGDDPGAAPLTLAWRGAAPSVLLVLDAATPTQVASVLRPLERLAGVDVAVLSVCEAPQLQRLLTAHGEEPATWRTSLVSPADTPPAPARTVRAVLATGHHLPAGAVAQRWAHEAGVPVAVVQHGLLTPFAPPLPRGALLLAFSEADARFYGASRPDVTSRVVGSQLLWEASRPERAALPEAAQARPVFLGQLHGAELPRADFARAARRFCEVTGAEYRPHPGERDRLSRAQHALWRARHLSVSHGDAALGTVDAPVASVFSTGVLEAAARGLPARVTHPDPPRWLEAYWERYGMHRWNGTAAGAGPRSDVAPATPAPWVPAREPALAVAEAVTSLLGHENHPEEPS